MKRLMLSIGILIALGLGAQAQLSKVCTSSDTGTACTPVTATKPLPVTGSITASGSLTVTGTVTASQGSPPWVVGSALQTASTPTIQAAAYSAGNCIGGFNAITLADSNGQSGFLTNFRIESLAGATPTLTVFLFDSQPSTSTCTDKGTFSLSAADVDKLIAGQTSVTLAAATSTTTPTVGSLDFTPPRPYRAGGSSSSGVKTIYYGMVTTAVTPSSASDLHIRAGAALN